MESLSLHPTAAETEPLDPAAEVARLETLLAERRAELSALQEEMREFKARYTQTVGARLAELAEVEQEIKEAEERRLGVGAEEDEEDAGQVQAAHAARGVPVKTALRKLFWSVARMFHPDHAGDEHEARRRHSIMAEASRAYRDGDVESLNTLLGDEQLQSFCATTRPPEEEEDLADRLLSLKEELRTVEFGLKRLTQDGLFRLKQRVAAEAAEGRDALAAEAERIQRQIVKARRRLEHLS
ncbi:MAG TPA: hypothetical protein VFS10_01510 [Pyrinomonadaceae bacterium]|nr:hypothetical protein [Pyrinomonadaceae bacterium]